MSPGLECRHEGVPLRIVDAIECGWLIPLPRLGEPDGFVERHDDEALW